MRQLRLQSNFSLRFCEFTFQWAACFSLGGLFLGLLSSGGLVARDVVAGTSILDDSGQGSREVFRGVAYVCRHERYGRVAD